MSDGRNAPVRARRRRWPMWAGALLAVTGMCAACSGGTSEDPSPSSEHVAGSTRTTPPVSLGNRPIRLTCADAGVYARHGPEDAPFGVVVGESALGELDHESDHVPLPLATDVGITSPPGMQGWYFRKAPVTIGAGKGPVTLILPSGADARLSWVPGDVWTGGTSPDLTAWETTEVTFAGCPKRDVMYLGGLLSRNPSGCIPLDVVADSAATKQFWWGLGRSTCEGR